MGGGGSGRLGVGGRGSVGSQPLDQLDVYEEEARERVPCGPRDSNIRFREFCFILSLPIEHLND